MNYAHKSVFESLEGYVYKCTDISMDALNDISMDALNDMCMDALNDMCIDVLNGISFK